MSAGRPCSKRLHLVGHQEHVHVAVLGPEGLHVRLVPQVVDELIYEVLALGVHDAVPGVLALHPVGDGVEQVGLAQAGGAVDEQRIIGSAGLICHLHGGGEGELVGGAYHEALEGVPVQVCGCGDGGGFQVVLPLLRQQQDHINVCGEEVFQGGLDDRQILGADDVELKLGGDAEDEAGLLQGYGFGVSEPGVYCDGSHGRLHHGLQFFPYISCGIHVLSLFR